MPAWHSATIAELGTTITGRTPPTSRPELFGDEFPFVTPSDMDGRRIITRTKRGISGDGAAVLRGKRLPAGSVAVSCIGWQLGKVAIIGTDAFCNQQLNVVIPNPAVDPAYLYYQLVTRRGEIRSLGAIGTRTPILKKSAFEQLAIPMPPPLVQRKIVAILSSCDELIENNNRRIKIIEEMAQRIYREWFVHYRYPRHEGEAFSDSQLGPIPRGWAIKTLGEVLAVIEAGSRPKGGIDPSERDVPSVGAENIVGLGRYDFDREKFVSRSFFERMRRGRVESGDVVLYKDGAHIGRVSMFRDGFPHAECAVNEHVFILRATEDYSQSLLYFWLAHPDNQSRVRALNANAAQPGLSQEKLRSLSLAVPPPGLVRRFTDVVEPMVGLIFRLALTVARARACRDLLLPRLISGEIDVADLKIAAPELAA